MNGFQNMTLDELIRPEGYDCECGRHHAARIAYLKCERGAILSLPEALRACGASRPFLVADKNTYAVAGRRAEEILAANGIPYTTYVIPGDGRIAPAEWPLGSICMHFDASCDIAVAVGSGVINDLTKVLAYCAHIPCGVIGTAPSMDGYASNSSSMEINNVKMTLYDGGPSFILCDSDILAQAPMRMLWAGLGDMAAKYISICEWRISHIVTGEYYCEDVASLMRSALKKIMDNADGIPSRDPDTIGAIAEGLIIGGIAMAYAQVSRPASGLEHYFSHMWEMQALERHRPYDLHGIQVGVGTVLTLRIYDKLRTVVPDRARAERVSAAFDRKEWEKEIRRIFGSTAPEIFKIEETARKNDPALLAGRLDAICAHWDEILAVIEEELPPAQRIVSLFKKLGMPVMPRDIGISDDDTVDAFIGARDGRNKYLSCSLIWDLGLKDEFCAYIRDILKDRRPAGRSEHPAG